MEEKVINETIILCPAHPTSVFESPDNAHEMSNDGTPERSDKGNIGISVKASQFTLIIEI